MKKLLILFSIGAVLFASQTAFGQAKLKTYRNARYGYSISYPPDLLAPQGEADNGDGQIFSNDRAEMRVFGSAMLLHETLSKEYRAVIKQSENVSYKTLRKNFFVVSGTRKKRIFYQKTIAKSDGAFATFYIEYAPDERAVYDKITTKIVESFK